MKMWKIYYFNDCTYNNVFSLPLEDDDDDQKIIKQDCNECTFIKRCLNC
ncbi:hypothetical protein [Clostridium sporogenes]|nr:hypothetical protein [Clostridium sporogenes]MDS1006603.1 hypothetical protein [Clostridium sporogenes]